MSSENKYIQEKCVTALVTQLKERLPDVVELEHFQYWTLQKFQKSQQMASRCIVYELPTKIIIIIITIIIVVTA